MVTTNHRHDCQALPDVLAKVADPIGQVTTDGADDTAERYAAIGNRQAQAVVPPRVDAVMHADAAWAARNATVERIAASGRAAWKVDTHYHRRSLAETTMFRLRTLFGAALTSRSLAGQRTEAALRCAALNRMT